MTKRRAAFLATTLILYAATGCSDSAPPPAAPITPGAPAAAGPSPSPGAAGGPAAAPAPATVTGGVMTPGGSPPQAMTPTPSTTPTPGDKPAVTPTPGTEPKPATEPTPPADTCEARRVSYAKPCSNDPNPCKIDSGYKGDEYCLLPPAADKGIQIHIGPKDYKDQAEIAKYTIKPGEEFNNSVIAHIPETEKRFWNRLTAHMRPGSHHWISSLVSGKPEVKFYPDTNCGATQVGSLGGGQNLIYDNPPGGVQAPENEGLGREMTADTSLCMNLHAYNFTDKPQIREMWINIHTVDESEVTQRARPIAMVGGLGLNLPAGQNKALTYMSTIGGDGRIIQLFGHRHVWTPRMAVWLNEKLVYDSWSWEESATYNYDSLSMNPAINTEGKTDGAVSGELPFKAGDTLKFTCFIENKSDHALRFSNELYGGEMCNLWGSTVGAGIAGTFL